MRHVLIDTDTASDDAVAIIAALRDPSIKVEAITVVAGNVPLPLAVKNALISVERANTYHPPVYQGAAKPILRPLFTSEFVHGSDGMGEMNLPDPTLTCAEGHAIDQIIQLAGQYAGELEIITLGPLTNLALACLKAPEIAQQVKSVFVMGGNGMGRGNITPLAEFNVFVDGEAAQIVINSGLPLTFVGWDVSTDETFINQADIDYLLGTGSPIAAFCVRCNQTLQDHNASHWHQTGFDLPDPVTVVAALYPEIITRQIETYSYIDCQPTASYGHMVIDEFGLLKKPANITLCQKVDAARFKALLFERII